DENGRRVPVALAGGDLAEHELAFAERRHLRLAAGTLDEVGEPAGGANDVVAVRRICAHRRDRDELAELIEPTRVHRAKANAFARSEAKRPARVYATSRSFAASASARSFFRLWFSIWRIRSRVTLKARPTSSRVRGCW